MTSAALRKSLFLAFLAFLFDHKNTVVAGSNIVMNQWSVSLDRRPFPKQNLLVGDSITFKLLGPHDVWIFPSRNCEDRSDKILIGTRGDGIAKYTITEADVGKTLFFACDAGSHCEMGQHMVVSVYAALDHIPWNAGYDVEITPGVADSSSRIRGTTVTFFATLVSSMVVLW